MKARCMEFSKVNDHTKCGYYLYLITIPHESIIILPNKNTCQTWNQSPYLLVGTAQKFLSLSA